ncbi:hypothetical protein GGI20_000963 [Coemansia sp. BCRC 34301]|nr:hypothetical protein GGI20_000963 [Coemansia sp. BCRC 34301]
MKAVAPALLLAHLILAVHAQISNTSIDPTSVNTSSTPPPTSSTTTSSSTPPPTSSTSTSSTPPTSSSSTPPPTSSSSTPTPTSSSSTPLPPSSTDTDTDDVTITSIVTSTTFSSKSSTTPSPTPSSTTTSDTHPGKDGTSSDEPTSKTDTDTDKPNPPAESSNSKSLSSGAIAGIVVGALILAIGAILGLLFWRRHKQKTQYAQKIDYAEFPEFNPSTSNNGLPYRPPPPPTGPPALGTNMPYYSDKSNPAVNATPSSNGAGPSHPHAYGHPVSDPSLLRELDEA